MKRYSTIIWGLIKVHYKEYQKSFFRFCGLLLLASLLLNIMVVTSIFDGLCLEINQPTLSKVIALRPEEKSLIARFSLTTAGLFCILGTLLPFFHHEMSKRSHTLYILKRLPAPNWSLALAQYLPGLFVLLIGYLIGLLQLLSYLLIYCILIPTVNHPNDLVATYFSSPFLKTCYPVNQPISFLPIIAGMLLLPCLPQLPIWCLPCFRKALYHFKTKHTRRNLYEEN